MSMPAKKIEPKDEPKVLKFAKHNFLRRVGYGLRGIKVSFVEEQNLPVHLVIAASAGVGGFFADMSVERWCLFALCVAIAIMAELFNTAIERLSRAITDDYHPEIRDALDMASGAVFIVAVGAAIVGVLIVAWPLVQRFWPG
jgi:diacylglycerol kinase